MNTPMKRLFRYIAKNKFYLILSLFVALIFVSCDVLIPLLCGKAIDEITLFINHAINPDLFIKNGDQGLVNFYLSLIIGLTALSVLFSYIFDTFITILTEKISKDLKDDVFIKINKLPLCFIDSHKRGDLISREINDVENVSIGLTGSFKQGYQGVITILITIGFMFYLNWILGLIVLVLTPISFIFSYVIAKNNNKYFKKQAKIHGNLAAIALEDVNNIDIIKSFNYEGESLKKFEKINEDLYKSGQKAQFYSACINPLTRLINNSIYAIIAIAGAILIIVSYKNGTEYFLGALSTIGTLSTFLQYTNKFSKPFNEMSSSIAEVQQGYASLKRIDEILSYENDIDNGKEKLQTNINTITFDHIDFSYDLNKPLIKDFNLKINKGMKVAIVGPTGCGKTTMINLLLRFYDPNNGNFFFNKIKGTDINKKELRNNFGMVLQDTWIFNGTVFENIAYSKKEATKEEVYEAAKNANAYNFIMRLPYGFDTKISDDSGLSQGQKQLITIARVMLINPSIMILDEATSNIDTRSELKIIEAFNKLTKGRTSFVIAHRLSTIVNSDIIIVMKDGSIIETGKHEELLKNHGFYFELFNAQFNDN